MTHPDHVGRCSVSRRPAKSDVSSLLTLNTSVESPYVYDAGLIFVCPLDHGWAPFKG